MLLVAVLNFQWKIQKVWVWRLTTKVIFQKCLFFLISISIFIIHKKFPIKLNTIRVTNKVVQILIMNLSGQTVHNPPDPRVVFMIMMTAGLKL